jgi:hypothetical protein
MNTEADMDLLNAFVAKAHARGPYIKVSFVAASENTVNEIKEYILSYPNIPDGTISEHEFWNSGNSFLEFSEIMAGMTGIKTTLIL